MAKSTTDEYQDESRSQGREMRGERKIKKLRVELEEAEQTRNEKLAKEAEGSKAKSRRARGAAGVAEYDIRRRGDSTEASSGGHRKKENPEANEGENGKSRPSDRSKMAAKKRFFSQKVEREVNRRMQAVGVRGQHHVSCSELAGAHTERAGHRDHDTDKPRAA